MPTNLTIKNIPDHLYGYLKKDAARNHRSIDKEVIAIIEKVYENRTLTTDKFLAKARELRKKSAKFVLTEEVMNQARNEGRA